ncbi:transcriptional regulator [Thermoanaerobacterium sp. PSU-2]|uniref:helix-turn-helix transcriptional regulator n=1 Tax=Thermoanaerobacterium sp. PSU-2 TaxID=1930849 RepID=UPI000A15B8FC|nr:helix-turn-helix transcriptional regulator [Thermoanaerobacterium sp. PSU-2]ORX23371.1 transcriptional regulator [Thermoanaerobacterium sp. PSU-2]
MNKRCENIYKTARKNAGITQEKAAELLYISSRTLSEYENGRLIPSDDIVYQMVELYKAPWLAYQHLRCSSEIGKKFLPDITLTDLARSILKLQKEIKDVENINNDLIEIGCDGIIDDTEKDKWALATKEIDEMAGAALAVIFAR